MKWVYVLRFATFDDYNRRNYEYPLHRIKLSVSHTLDCDELMKLKNHEIQRCNERYHTDKYECCYIRRMRVKEENI